MTDLIPFPQGQKVKNPKLLQMFQPNKVQNALDLAWILPTAPFSDDVERALIGSVMINPNLFVSMVSIVQPSHFFLLRHAYIWRALQRLDERGDAIDILTLTAELEAVGYLDEVGGRAYIAQACASVPDSTHAETYARLVERLAIRRNMMEASDKIKELAFNMEIRLEDAAIRSEAILADALKGAVNAEPKSALQVMGAALDHIENLRSGDEDTVYLPTGYRALDSMIRGGERGYVTCIAGRPNMGKSALALNLGISMARLGIRVMVLACESTVEQMSFRLLGIESGIPSAKIKDAKQLNTAEYQRVVDAAGKLAKLPLYTEYVAGLTPAEVRAACARVQREGGLDVLIVDGLYEMKMPGVENRFDEVKQVAMAIREITRELRIHTYITHQVNRGCEKRKDKRPVMSDLEYTGEQSFDNVWFIYRDVEYNEDTEFPNQAEIIVSKSRDGAKGIVSLYYEPSITKFVDGVMRVINLSEPQREE